MPEEFVLYSENNALQFISSQPKLKQRHASGLNFYRILPFIKHTSGDTNKVVDALSRINLILQELQVNT
jgi:hypothetical protein